MIGAVRHFTDDDRSQLRIELLSDEAVKTSQIEGEFLDRASVQSSLRRHFGLDADNRPVRPQERATATRDLQQLSEIGALTRTGERRHTRYALKL